MKNFLFLIISFWLFVLPASGQKAMHEIYLGLGALSRPYGVDVFGHYLQKGVRGAYATYGTYHLGYKLSITPRQSLGLNYVYERQQHRMQNSSNPTDTSLTSATHQFHTVMADLTQYWNKQKWTKLYSALSLGVCFFSKDYVNDPHRKEQQLKMAYQVTPLGISVGKTFSGFAEIGYGYKGIFCAGINFRF